MAQTATLAHWVKILDDHMYDSNWKKLLNMVPFLCQKYLTAIEMSEATVHYFAEWSAAISAQLISSWEAEITIAESLRDQDKKAMDILKAWSIGLQARHGGNLADTGMEAGGRCQILIHSGSNLHLTLKNGSESNPDGFTMVKD
ncbi:hypothetical protein C0989_004833 [Termitomyces sp. Mn162]|nr:hypothetical protein C0989_004833 [Termitomyces sp. Mn162]